MMQGGHRYMYVYKALSVILLSSFFSNKHSKQGEYKASWPGLNT